MRSPNVITLALLGMEEFAPEAALLHALLVLVDWDSTPALHLLGKYGSEYEEQLVPAFRLLDFYPQPWRTSGNNAEYFFETTF